MGLMIQVQVLCVHSEANNVLMYIHVGRKVQVRVSGNREAIVYTCWVQSTG